MTNWPGGSDLGPPLLWSWWIHHRDPFDRVIVARALLESLPVVTSDAALVGFPAMRIVW